MNNYIDVGKIINTFGIKGELKVASDFEYKDKVFLKDFPVYIGELKEKEIINSHRIHKNYHLTTFKGYTNINEVLKYKGARVYVVREDLNLGNNEYLLNDLIGFEVYDKNQLLGVVIDYENTPNSILLKVKGDKTFYLPKIEVYIQNIDVINKKIFTNKGSDLII